MADVPGIEFEIRGSANGATGAIRELRETLEKLNGTLSGISATSAVRQLRSVQDATKQATKSFSSATSGIGKFLSSLKRIAMYRAIRGIISSITNSIKEGIGNMYEYSRVVGGDFAAALDTAKSAATSWKNSLAAAFAPLIEWIVPYLQKAVQWIIELNNTIGAFFAALTGKDSYMKAIWYQDQYKESVSQTTSAVQELQRYLAPFDELNVMDDKSSGSGGGSGSSTPDYSSMFVKESLPEWAQSVKQFLDTIKGWIGDFWDWLTGLGIIPSMNAIWNDIVEWYEQRKSEIQSELSEQGLGGKLKQWWEELLQSFSPEFREEFLVNAGVVVAVSPDGLSVEDAIKEKLSLRETYNYYPSVSINIKPAINVEDTSDLSTESAIKEKLDLKNNYSYNIPTTIIGSVTVSDFELSPVSVTELKNHIQTQFGLQNVTASPSVEIVVDKEKTTVSSESGESIKSAIKSKLTATQPVYDGNISSLLFGDPENWGVEEAILLALGAALAPEVIGPAIAGMGIVIPLGPDEIEFNLDQLHGDNISIPATASIEKIIDSLTDSQRTINVYGKIDENGLVNFGLGTGVELTVTPKIGAGSSTISEFAKEQGLIGNGVDIPISPLLKYNSIEIEATANLTTTKTSLKTTPEVQSSANFTTWNTNFGTEPWSWVKGVFYKISEGSDGSLFSNLWAWVKGVFWKQTEGSDGSLFSGLWAWVKATFWKQAARTDGSIFSATLWSWVQSIFWYQAKGSDGSLFSGLWSWVKSVFWYETKGSNGSLFSGLWSWVKSVFWNANGGVWKNGAWSKIQGFASGGFPDTAQLFIAREAGPELVGTLKGHTAVMNNDQIVASVSAGVARAISSIEFHMDGFSMAAAMPTYDEDDETEEMMYRAFMRAMTDAGLLESFDINVTAELDGEAIYQNTVRRNRASTRMTNVNALA